MVFDSTPPEAKSEPAAQSSQPGPREPKSLTLLTNGASILDEEPGRFVFGALRNVMVVVWRQQARADDLRRLGVAAGHMRKCHPEGRSSIHVVMDGAEPPTPEAQEGFVHLMQQAQLACIGVVFLGNGFWASRLRSNSTSMVLRVEKKFELRQHSSIAELASWLPMEHERRTGIRIKAGHLCTVVRAFVDGSG